MELEDQATRKRKLEGGYPPFQPWSTIYGTLDRGSDKLVPGVTRCCAKEMLCTTGGTIDRHRSNGRRNKRKDEGIDVLRRGDDCYVSPLGNRLWWKLGEHDRFRSSHNLRHIESVPLTLRMKEALILCFILICSGHGYVDQIDLRAPTQVACDDIQAPESGRLAFSCWSWKRFSHNLNLWKHRRHAFRTPAHGLERPG